MGKEGSYDFGGRHTAQAQEEEIQRLEVQSAKHARKHPVEWKNLGIKAGMKGLDIGCGTGSVLRELAACFDEDLELVGADHWERGLQAARELAIQEGFRQINFKQMPAEQLTFDNGLFDFVHMRLVLMHVGDPIAVLAQAKRVLRPGGIIIVQDTDRTFDKVFPYHDDWESHIERVRQCHAKKGNPCIGKEIGPMLHKLDFQDVEVRAKLDGELFTDIDFFGPTPVFLPKDEQEPAWMMLRSLVESAPTTGTYAYKAWFLVTGRK